MNDTELVVCITGAAGHIATALYSYHFYQVMYCWDLGKCSEIGLQ